MAHFEGTDLTVLQISYLNGCRPILLVPPGIRAWHEFCRSTLFPLNPLLQPDPLLPRRAENANARKLVLWKHARDTVETW